jgi:hypothetical protein
MAKPKRPHSGQRGSQGSQRPGGSAGASRGGAPARTQQPRAAQTTQTTATQATRTAQSGQNTQTTRTTQTARATQPTTAKPAMGAAGAPKTHGAAPNRYRPLSAREPSARGAAKRRQAAQPWWRQNAPVLGAVITVVLLVAVFVLIAHNASGGPTTGIGAPVPPAIASALAPTDPSIFAKVSTGGVPNPFKHVNTGGDFLKGPDGKPEFLYAGAEYCPYCAAERWSMIMALNRFGSFSGLKQTLSGDAPESSPDTPTFTFADAKYSSKYITFSSVELQGRRGQSDTLQTPTALQNQVVSKYNSPQYLGQNAGGIPFISVANQYITNGAGYSPSILENERWDTIASKLSDPNSEVTKDIVGNANYITAAICQTTNQTPDTVCKAAPIPDIEKKL